MRMTAGLGGAELHGDTFRFTVPMVDRYAV